MPKAVFYVRVKHVGLGSLCMAGEEVYMGIRSCTDQQAAAVLRFIDGLKPQDIIAAVPPE